MPGHSKNRAFAAGTYLKARDNLRLDKSGDLTRSTQMILPKFLTVLRRYIPSPLLTRSPTTGGAPNQVLTHTLWNKAPCYRHHGPRIAAET